MGRTTCRCLLGIMVSEFGGNVPSEKLDAIASVMDDLLAGTGVMGLGGISDVANALIYHPEKVDEMIAKLTELRDTLKAEGKL